MNGIWIYNEGSDGRHYRRLVARMDVWDDSAECWRPVGAPGSSGKPAGDREDSEDGER